MTIELLSGKEPVMLINAMTMAKMLRIVKSYPKEIAWFNTVRRIGEPEDEAYYMFGDPIIMWQTVTSTTCDSTEEEIGKTAEAFLEQNPDADLDEMRCWGHSHVNMGVNPSGTDAEQLKDYADSVPDFFVRLIMNKKDDVRIDIVNVERGLLFTNIKWELSVTANEAAEIEDDIKERVVAKTYAPATTYKSNYANANHKNNKPYQQVGFHTGAQSAKNAYTPRNTSNNYKGSMYPNMMLGEEDEYDFYEDYDAQWEAWEAANQSDFEKKAIKDKHKYAVGQFEDDDELEIDEDDEGDDDQSYTPRKSVYSK